MRRFCYVGVRDGMKTRGVLEAESKRAAAERLRTERLATVRVHRIAGQTGELLHRVLGRR